MKVLWLASWYPNRTDPSNGDFIERHARATAAFTDQLFLIAVVKDTTMQKGHSEIIKTQQGRLSVYTAFYGSSANWGMAEKLLSFRKYFSLQKKIYRQIEVEHGMPDIVHVQVAMNAGLFALHLQSFKKIPYVVTEHWAGYSRKARPNIYEKGSYFLWLSKRILKAAAFFLPVSDELGRTVIQNLVPVNYKVIPNVVDTGLFFYRPVSLPVFRFIHLSYMHYQKNPDGILQACKILKDRGVRFELQMTGSKNEKLERQAADWGLQNEYVFFENAVPYAEVANRMQQASALLLFSRFENLPCVMLEALCCGLPVVSSRVGGIAEVINESNGILVDSENVAQLAAAMETMIHTYASFNREEISAKARRRFNYNVVGKQYLEVYQQVLQQRR